MTQEVHFGSWMGDADATIWRNELDPRLRSTIISVWVLDRMPDEERFARTLDFTLSRIPRLRQRVVEDPFGIAPPRWEDDPRFDPSFHLRHLTLGGQGSLRSLLDLAEPIAMQAFDKDRPLWEFYLVSGLEGAKAGVIMKLHHAVSDGMGLLRMTEFLVERTRDADPRKLARDENDGVGRSGAHGPASNGRNGVHEGPSYVGVIRDALVHRGAMALGRARRTVGFLGRGFGSLLRHPFSTARDAGDFARSLVEVLHPESEPLSPVMRDRGMTLRLHAFTLPLDDLRAAAHVAGGTVNDAFLASMAGGMRLYHERHGKPVAELRITMPVNLRTREDAARVGNRFTTARICVPIHHAEPLERMQAIQERVRSVCAEPALRYTEEIAGVINMLPRFLAVSVVGGILTANDFVISNVPGPVFPVYMSGAKIERMFPMGPTSGAALNITLFSYEGVCQIGVNCDRTAVPDSDFLVECLKEGAREVLALNG